MQALIVIAIIFLLLAVYSAYCLIDILLLKSRVRKEDKKVEIDTIQFNILRLLLRVKSKVGINSKRIIFKDINKLSLITLIIIIICIIILILDIALYSVLKNMDSSMSVIASSIIKKDEEDTEDKVDSDKTENSWVPNKDEWRYEDKSEEYKTGDYAGIFQKPGNAKGPLAITLNDGSYFWYHQSTSCLTCTYCGSWSGMTWGGLGNKRSLLGRDGCAVYAMAIAISNLKGTAITPKDILKACESIIDESVNDCTTSPKYFYNRGLLWDPMPNRIAEKYEVNIETVGHNISDIDRILDKGGYVWFWMNSSTKANWPWAVSGGHFIIIRKHDGYNYYCFDSCDNPSSGFTYMNTPVKKSDVIDVMKDTRAVGLWVDKVYNSTGEWYYYDTESLPKYTSLRKLGEMTIDNNGNKGDINLYNGLPWEPVEGMYIADCEAMLYDMANYVNTVSDIQLDLDLDYILNDSRMINTSAGLNEKGEVRVQGNNWVSEIYGYNPITTKPIIGSVCTIDEVNCLGVCVPATVADPNYNPKFKDGPWQYQSSPSSSVYGYSTQKIACILKGTTEQNYGEIVYLPCSHIDAKAHTFPGGIAQTNVMVTGCEKDSSDKVVKYNVNIARDWSGTINLNESWALNNLGHKMNSKLIDCVGTPVSPISMVNNVAEFWNVPEDVYNIIDKNYQVIGYVVWPKE